MRDLIFFVIKKKGFPDLLFLITISLKFKLLRNPVPNDFEKASFAANLFAKKAVLLAILVEFKIS